MQSQGCPARGGREWRASGKERSIGENGTPRHVALSPDVIQDPPASSRQRTGPGRYRPDIDGLRGVAILAVIINHINPSLLPGGYLGVDVFFVISGFVITGSLAGRRAASPGEFLLGFYERRIRRLMPALVVCVVVTGLLLSLVDPDPRTRLAVGWRSLLGFSNISLYNLATDYFSSATDINPFTHTWSLGVEEQFYLVFPLLLLWTGFHRVPSKASPWLARIIGVLSIISLIAFLSLHGRNHPAVFFLMPYRFWELGAGCLLCLAISRRKSWPFRLNAIWRKVPDMLIILLLMGAFLLPFRYNLLATLLTVILTVALIARLSEGAPAHQFLSHAIPIKIGLLSYSLYLWHWSVLSLSRWTIGISWKTIPFQIILIALLAYGSYRWIEQPLRSRQWCRQQLRSIGYGVAAAVTGAAFIIGLSQKVAARIYLGTTTDQGRSTSQQEKPVRCESEGVFPVYFAGDSHANHYRRTHGHGCRKHAINIQVASTAGMPYPPLSYTNSYRGQTQEANFAAYRTMEARWASIPLPPAGQGVVVLSLRPGMYFSGLDSGIPLFARTQNFDSPFGQPITSEEALSNWLEALDRLVSMSSTINFIVLTPTPDFASAYPIEICTPQWFRPTVSRSCHRTTERTSLLALNRGFEHAIRGLAGRHSNLYIFDAFSTLCPASQTYCPRFNKGETWYNDSDHLSLPGANRVIDDLVVFLRREKLMPARPLQ